MDNKYTKMVQGQDAKLAKLHKDLQALMFVTQEEIDSIMLIMNDYPKEAFVKVNELIKKGKAKQNNYLEDQVKKDPVFFDKLKQELDSQYQNATKKSANKESDEAIKLLDKLEEI